MIRVIHSIIRQNSYFIVTFLIGLGISIFFSPEMVHHDCTNLNLKVDNIKIRKMLQDIDMYEPKINLAAKPKSALKGGHGLIRPRFHKAELGIRNKLFLGILTSPGSISSLAIGINKTVSKFVDKIMFFIDAPSAQRLNVSLLKLPGIVGFTDTRTILKPFHLIKYVSDNFLEDYDYFFISKDTGYIQAQKLHDFTRKISINNDIHIGHVLQKEIRGNKICSLDFGILLSNSVLKKMQKSLEWCVKNDLTTDDSINVGNCILHATKVPCSEFAQGSKFETFSIKEFQNGTIIPTYETELQTFQEAIIIAPLTSADQHYYIHSYFLLNMAEKINKKVEDLRTAVIKMSEVKISGVNSWPTAIQQGAIPVSHFDVLRWDHFTLSHKYLNNDFSNRILLTGSEKEDIQRIVSRSVSFIENRYEGALKFHNFLNGYQRFDPSRGMDYIIDLAFRETTSGKITHKRLDIFKSLGKVEMVPVPYVTENVRVHLIIPVKSSDHERIMTFLKQYSINAMEKKDLQLLMMVFIYNSNEVSKGDDDIFKEVKQKAVSLSTKFEKVGILVKWHSIKLPVNMTNLTQLTDSLLDFAIMDSVLRKFSFESLVLLANPNMEIRLDYFNRVRMNTVSGFQVYSAIPFSEFNPDIIYNNNRPQPPELDINKNYGHYDTNNFRHISFYIQDYFKARKKMENIIPIARYDKDIMKLVRSSHTTKDDPFTPYVTHGLYNMFLKNSKLHMLRAVEPSLRLRNSLETCSQCNNSAEFNEFCIKMQSFNLATRSQLGRLMLDYHAEV